MIVIVNVVNILFHSYFMSIFRLIVAKLPLKQK